MHGDNVRKAIKGTEDRNKITQGVNDYAKTNPLNFSGKQWPLETSLKKPAHTAKLKSGATPGETVREQVDKVRKTNLKARAINDYDKSTGNEPKRNEDRKAFRVNSLKHNKPGQAKSTAPSKNRWQNGKYIAEAGSGSIPSSTNTHIAKVMDGRQRQSDGSYRC